MESITPMDKEVVSMGAMPVVYVVMKILLLRYLRLGYRKAKTRPRSSTTRLASSKYLSPLERKLCFCIGSRRCPFSPGLGVSAGATLFVALF